MITFSIIQSYLNAILTKANGDIDASPHKRFWDTDYVTFRDGVIPGGADTSCEGNPVPIINKENPVETAFYLILKGRFCDMPRMPFGGEFAFKNQPDGSVSTPTYDVTLPDGTVAQKTGVQILADIEEWLTNGYPE